MIEKIKQGYVLPNKIVIKEVAETEKKTESGIIVPVLGKNPQTKAKVVLVGTGTPEMPMNIPVGSIILFTPMAAQKFTFEDEEFLLLDQNNVLFWYNE